MEIIGCAKDGQCNIEKAVNVLASGGIVVMPTDTVYGLACDAANQSAVDRIYKIKERDKSSTLAVLVGGIEDIYDYAEVGDMEKKYIEEFLPGPVTVILKAKESFRDKFSSNTINPNGGVGFRVVNFKCVEMIAKNFGQPIALTSANKSKAGSFVPDVGFVQTQFGHDLESIDLVIDAGHLGDNQPSMVVDLTRVPYEIVRYGGDRK